jgi:hypothetical protein
MLIVPLIRHANQIAIKAYLRGCALISSGQQDGLALWIKDLGNSPNTTIGIEAQLFHVGVARTLERICLRPAEQRAILAEYHRHSFQLLSNHLGQLPDFNCKIVVKLDRPIRIHSMLLNA